MQLLFIALLILSFSLVAFSTFRLGKLLAIKRLIIIQKGNIASWKIGEDDGKKEAVCEAFSDAIEELMKTL